MIFKICLKSQTQIKDYMRVFYVRGVAIHKLIMMVCAYTIQLIVWWRKMKNHKNKFLVVKKIIGNFLEPSKYKTYETKPKTKEIK